MLCFVVKFNCMKNLQQGEYLVLLLFGINLVFA